MSSYEIYKSTERDGYYIALLYNYCDMLVVQEALTREGYVILKAEGLYIHCKKWGEFDE